MTKCSCGGATCQMQWRLDEDNGCMVIEDSRPIIAGVPHLYASMYLDANGAVELIKALKRFLLAQADKS